MMDCYGLYYPVFFESGDWRIQEVCPLVDCFLHHGKHHVPNIYLYTIFHAFLLITYYIHPPSIYVLQIHICSHFVAADAFLVLCFTSIHVYIDIQYVVYSIHVSATFTPTFTT